MENQFVLFVSNKSLQVSVYIFQMNKKKRILVAGVRIGGDFDMAI